MLRPDAEFVIGPPLRRALWESKRRIMFPSPVDRNPRIMRPRFFLHALLPPEEGGDPEADV